MIERSNPGTSRVDTTRFKVVFSLASMSFVCKEGEGRGGGKGGGGRGKWGMGEDGEERGVCVNEKVKEALQEPKSVGF